MSLDLICDSMLAAQAWNRGVSIKIVLLKLRSNKIGFPQHNSLKKIAV